MTVVLPDQALALAAERLEFGDAAARVRAESLAKHAGPLDLALELNPRLRRTPATELLSERFEHAITTPGSRLIVSMPPQETKTSIARHAVLRKMQHHPEHRNAIASYAVDLARTSGRFIRGVIEANGTGVVDPATGQALPDRLGLRVRGDHAAAGDWALDGHDGALYAIGVGGGLTGRPVDGVLIIDDPVKDREQADSPVLREKVAEWRSAVAETRLGPEACVVLIMTRWHEADLAGRLITEDMQLPPGEREWEVINIPALAHPEVQDSLEGVPGARDPDGWLVSARGRTGEQWTRIRRRVGERTFGALYQGSPKPLEGGIFKQGWIDANRVDVAPDNIVATTVAVDPADTGQGDAAGILVGSRAADGTLYVRADVSDQLSQGQWARRVCLVAVRLNADTILQESNLGMGRALRDGWAIIVRQARALDVALRADADDPIRHAQDALVAVGDSAAAGEAELLEVQPWVDEILSRPSTGPSRIEAVTPRQSKYVRANAVTGFYETGRARHVGKMPLLEFEMTTWQVGQKSPNRLDTLAHLLTHLDSARFPTAISSPTRTGAGGGRVPTRSAGTRRSGGRRR